MKKIIAITLSLALLAPSFGVPAKAQTATPNPSNNSGNFMWKGSNYSILRFSGDLSGTTWQLDFPADSSLSWVDAGLSNEERSVFNLYGGNTYETVKAYRFQNGSGSGNLNVKFSCAKDPCTPNQMPFLVIGFSGQEQTVATLIGMFFYAVGKDPDLGFPYLGPKTGDVNTPAVLTKLTTTNAYTVFGGDLVVLGKMKSLITFASNKPEITINLTGTDLNSMCTNLTTTWDSTKQMVRDFFIPAPGTEAVSKNENWTTVNSSWGKQAISGTTLRNNALAALQKIGLSEDYLNNAKTDTLGVTAIGEAHGATIMDNIANMKETVAKLKQSTTKLEGGTTEWPCGNGYKLTEFKKSISAPANQIKSLDDLSTSLVDMEKTFTLFKTRSDDPGGDGSNCSPPSRDNGIMSMIKEAFCSLTVILKDQADKWFLWAKGWMVTVIGVEESGEKGEVTDDPLQSDGASPAGSSAESPPATTPVVAPASTTPPPASTPQ